MKAITEIINRMLTLFHEKAETSCTSFSQTVNFVEKRKKYIYRKKNAPVLFRWNSKYIGVHWVRILITSVNYKMRANNLHLRSRAYDNFIYCVLVYARKATVLNSIYMKALIVRKRRYFVELAERKLVLFI